MTQKYWIFVSFRSENDQNITGEMNFKKAVEEGLRAKVTPTDPITGILYVDLVFEENQPYTPILQGDKYPILPSVSYDSTGMMGQLNQLVTKLNQLLGSTNKIMDENAQSIHEILLNLNETMKNINTLVAKKEIQGLPKEFDKSVKKLNEVLQSADSVLKGYEGDSLMNHQLTQTLKVVTETSEEMTKVLKMIDRKPNSLIFGED